MTALLVLNYDVRDGGLLDEYRTEAAGVLLDGDAVLLASSARTHDLGEGATATGTHTVVLAYPSVAEALRRYRSDEYQRSVGQRFAATTPRAAFVVDAIEGAVENARQKRACARS